MAKRVLALLLVMCGFVSSVAVAQSCTQYRLSAEGAGGSAVTGPDRAALGPQWCAANAAACKTYCSYNPASGTYGSIRFEPSGTTCDAFTSSKNFTTAGTGACPACNTTGPGVGESFVVNTSVPASSCNPVTHCKMQRGSGVCMGASCVYTVTHTNQVCENDTEQNQGTPDEKCASGVQVEFCKSADAGNKNCGYVNDEFTCVDSVKADECKVFADGGRICGASAPMPPKPDNGTAGQPATPDEQVTVTNAAGSTTTVNFFNSTTVANSERDPGTTGQNPFDDGEEEEEGEGEASGGEGCDAPPSCSGDAVLCAVLHQEWLTRCPAEVTNAQIDAQLGDNPVIPSTEHDMSSALSQTLVVGSGGECPAPTTVTLPGGSQIEIDVITWFCSLAERIAPLVMVMAYLVAVMIVARGTEG
jgi:hypothetical protein